MIDAQVLVHMDVVLIAMENVLENAERHVITLALKIVVLRVVGLRVLRIVLGVQDNVM